MNTPASENMREGTESWRLRAQSEGELSRNLGVEDEGDVGVLGAGEEDVGVPGAGVPDAEEEGGGGLDDLRTYSNHPPASPLETHAARIAAKPTRGSCLCVVEEVIGAEGVESSWTIATPAVRRNRANHFVRESDRRKNSNEKSAVVSSLSYQNARESARRRAA